MKTLLCAIVLFAFCNAASAQSTGLWQSADHLAQTHSRPAAQPKQFRAFSVNERSLQEYLAAAPALYEEAIIIDLPAPDGSLQPFHVWRTPVMDGQEQSFPAIATYTAEAVGAHHITAKLDYTPAGFHALVFANGGSYLIDPYGKAPDGAYIVYSSRDVNYAATGAPACGVDDGAVTERMQPGHFTLPGAGLPQLRLNGAVRRQYRLALACTGEYAVSVAGSSPTKAAVLANMATVVNRVNGIYEREFSITLQLVGNDTNVIYLNGATDPYTNGNASIELSENNSNLNTKIGNANYDVGHLLATGSLGLGQLGCVCSGNKGYGVSFLAGSVTHQIIAHELGHQFGANHTFNSTLGSCNTNGVAANAYEPGSGSTIMAYPGLCSTDDYQGNKDEYYHSASLIEISGFVSVMSTCGSTIPSANINPTIPAFAKTYNVPYRTPFELTAPNFIDSTADSLRYCWEECDLGAYGTPLAQTYASGPLFRTFPPATSATRVFPCIPALVGARPFSGEKLPDTARVLNFRLTERDYFRGWGAFNMPNDTVKLNVINTHRPFTVAYPAGGERLAATGRPIIRWDIAGTAAAPINCTFVDILLSVDSGYTFPYMLKAGTPNDGSETVILPNIPASTKARIKVRAAGNVFFNISAANFTLFRINAAEHIQALGNEIRISPLPARDVVQIDAPAELGTLRVQALNMMGQVVWSGTMSGHKALPVTTWARGLYGLQLSNDAGLRVSRKLVLQ